MRIMNITWIGTVHSIFQDLTCWHKRDNIKNIKNKTRRYYYYKKEYPQLNVYFVK